MQYVGFDGRGDDDLKSMKSFPFPATIYYNIVLLLVSDNQMFLAFWINFFSKA